MWLAKWTKIFIKELKNIVKKVIVVVLVAILAFCLVKTGAGYISHRMAESVSQMMTPLSLD